MVEEVNARAKVAGSAAVSPRMGIGVVVATTTESIGETGGAVGRVG